MQLQDWKILEERALWLLEHADQASPREPLQGMALQLRLWRYRSSGPNQSWSIILPVREYRERGAVVREASWDRSQDWNRRMTAAERLKRRRVLEPSVRIRDAQIGWDELAPFMDTAGGLRPDPPVAPPAARAESSGLEGSRAFAHVRLEWSGRGPRGWALTLTWFERFRKLLLRCLRERESGLD